MSTQAIDMGTAPIGKLLVRLTIPAILAQIVNILYNIIDRIFIGHIAGIGDVALTGVGLTFPIIVIIASFSAFVGMGAAPLASIKMGEQNNPRAEKILGNGVTLLVIMTVVLMITLQIFKEPLLYLFGGSEQTVGYGKTYLGIYLCGTLFVQLAMGLNSFISIQGFAKTAMASICIGAVVNLILDPILIFGFSMGVAGAALATVISQAISAIWIVSFLLSKRSTLHIRKENLRLERKLVFSVLALGVSPFIMQSTEALVQIVLNSSLQHYGGDLYVGSMTILLSIMQLFTAPLAGFTMGAQPILSYNYGAGNVARVRATFKRVLICALTFSVLGWVACLTVPQLFAQIFTPNGELVALTTQMLPIFMAGFFALGIQNACQSTFIAMGQAKISLFLALLRKIILLIPLTLILPLSMGVNGIYFAEPIADVLAVATTLTLFLLNFKRILTKKAKEVHLAKGGNI